MMNKEKQIEEMAKVIRGYARDYDDDIYGCEDHLAHHLTEAGYRKASDVAREIIADLERAGLTESRYPVIAELKKRYTESEDTE